MKTINDYHHNILTEWSIRLRDTMGDCTIKKDGEELTNIARVIIDAEAGKPIKMTLEMCEPDVILDFQSPMKGLI